MRQTLRQAGEVGLIAAVQHALRGRVGPLPLIGIGDDAAAWEQERAVLVASTDMLVESIHFDLRLTGWRDLGWKALAVNLSDLAAMGASARWALVAAGLRHDLAVEDIVDFYQGMRELADHTGCSVAGGDTVATPGPIIFGVTVLGSVPADERDTLLQRDRGRAGDLLAVTGTLGGSAAGLFALRWPDACRPEHRQRLAVAHRRPVPRLLAGQALRQAGVRCAMDVSDGLLADAAKLCTASGVAATIQAERLPVHPAALAAFPGQALRWAAAGGEDYELLFAAPPPVMEAALQALAATGVAGTVVGQLTPGNATVSFVDATGRDVPMTRTGWDHFLEEPDERRATKDERPFLLRPSSPPPRLARGRGRRFVRRQNLPSHDSSTGAKDAGGTGGTAP